jgi:hypothetical protein
MLVTATLVVVPSLRVNSGWTSTERGTETTGIRGMEETGILRKTEGIGTRAVTVEGTHFPVLTLFTPSSCLIQSSIFSRPEPEQQNPGNNLHVSGLSLDVEARDLEEYFGTVGKVNLFLVFPSPILLLTASPRTAATRSPRLRSCTTPTPALPVVSGSS